MTLTYKRQTSSVPTSSSRTQVNYSGVYIGFVKDNTDVRRMGRLRVYIPMLGGDANNPDYWHMVNYCTPFGGASPNNNNVTNSKILAGTQTSYGWWAIPPDIDNEVIVMFIDGNPSMGIWIGCLYQEQMNHMVPGIARDVSYPNSADCVPLPPVAEYNKTVNDSSMLSVESPIRPRFDPLANALAQEGLQTDIQRGPTNASARRDAPSQVYGYITPRGHHVYVDDGQVDTNINQQTNPPSSTVSAYTYVQSPEADEYIRLRTRNGTQVLINDTSGFVYINSKAGNSWIEVSDQGMNIFSQVSVNLRSMGDLNLHADKNINMYAGGNLSTYSVGNIQLQSNANIISNSLQGIFMSSNQDINILSLMNTNIQANNNMNVKVANDYEFHSATSGDNPIPAVVQPNLTTRIFTDRMLTPPCYPPVNSTTITSMTPTHEPWNRGPTLTPNEIPIGPPIQNNNPTNFIPTGPGQTKVATIPPTQTLTTGSGQQKVVATPYTGSYDSTCEPPMIRSDVQQALVQAASSTGQDPGYMFAVANTESSFNPNAMASTSSASGLFQFTSGTWSSMVSQYGSQTGITQDQILDPQANATMGGLFTAQNGLALENAGIDDTPTNLYLAHFFGAQGAINFINADPDASAASINPKAAAANPSLFYKNGQPITVQQFYNNINNKVSAQTAKFNNCIQMMMVASNTSTASDSAGP